MKDLTRKCQVCSKELQIKQDHIGARNRNATDKVLGHSSAFYTFTSDDGIYFQENPKSVAGVWFCNHCYEQIQVLDKFKKLKGGKKTWQKKQ